MPSAKPFLTAQWRYLVMLNYVVQPHRLEPLVPRGTQLDSYEGRTYISLVGFLFLDTRLRGCSLPGYRNFEEVNLRFYVCRHVDGEKRRGVVFIKELVPRWAVAKVARAVYNENYVAVPMRHCIQGFVPPAPHRTVEYAWRVGGRWDRVELSCDGQPQALEPGSCEQFIAQHYWGYCQQRDGGTIEYQVQHPPWNVWSNCQVQFDCDVQRLYGSEAAEAMQAEPASAFLADGSAVQVFRPRRLA